MGRGMRVGFPMAVAALLLGGGIGFPAGAPAARSDTPGSEIRFPVFEGDGIANDGDRMSSPPEIPFSIVDEVPGKSPWAVSGSWITIFEIDLTPIGTGTLEPAEPATDETAHPDVPEQF